MSRQLYTSFIERLAAHSVKTTCGCWIWLGSENWQGYGKITIRINGKATGRSVHRLAYAAWHNIHLEDMSFIGLVVSHTCHNRLCWAEEHLTLRTPADNIQDAIRRGTHMSVLNRYLASVGSNDGDS